MALLGQVLRGRVPHWTREIHQEVLRGVGRFPELQRILDAGWMGTPWEPDTRDLKEIYKLQVGLNFGRVPATRNAGEAECILACRRLNGDFVTDDVGATDFARRRGITVIDCVTLLQEGVAGGDVTGDDCWAAVQRMQAAGRAIRPAGTISRGDFN